MDFEPYDSSGTDDDLPPSHQNRIPRGRLPANGRSAVISSAPYSRIYGETDMETEIHNIEKEAYVSVLRAFKAQADVLTWEKQEIISNLRRELRLSDDEHKELIGIANADDTIRRIREWRMELAAVGEGQTGISTNQLGHDRLPSPAVSASRKKQKVVSSVHQSFGGPSPLYHSQALTSNPQSSSAAKKGQNIGPKGKKQKSSMQFPSSGSANRISSGVLADEPSKARDPLIGKKVKTRWPDDNNFYEAIITDFDPAQGRHALIYDAGTANETWEWVNLAEISPNDIRWEGGDPGIHRGSYGGPGHGINRPVGHDGTLGAGRGNRLPKGSNRKDYPPAQNGVAKKRSSVRMLHTNHLVKEVEKVFNSSNPDPLEIEKAKKALKEQEEALIDALGMLADISEGESD